jgi:hypothetical protein
VTGSRFLRVFRFLDFDFDISNTRCSVIAAVVSATFGRLRSLISTSSAGEAVVGGRLIKRLFSFNRLCEAARSLFLRALSWAFFRGEKYGLWTMWGSGVFSELVCVAAEADDLVEPVACRLRGVAGVEVSVFSSGQVRLRVGLCSTIVDRRRSCGTVGVTSPITFPQTTIVTMSGRAGGLYGGIQFTTAKPFANQETPTSSSVAPLKPTPLAQQLEKPPPEQHPTSEAQPSTSGQPPADSGSASTKASAGIASLP